jgi:hypothetical protein
MNVQVEHAPSSDLPLKEVFSKRGDMLSYYPVRMMHFIGGENLTMIPKIAIVMSRTVLVNEEYKDPNYFLELTSTEWNEYVGPLELQG